MKWLEILKRMFVERYCLICGEAISYDEPEPFCVDCIDEWRSFKKVRCRSCGRESLYCTCLPKKVKKINFGMACWSYFYDASTNGEINTLFRYLKRKYDRSIIDFCAEKMKISLLHLFKNRGIDYKEYSVTYAPRRRGSVSRYGFDQSEKLAKCLAKKLGLKVVKAFINNGKSEQKGLNKQERAANAQESYKYIEGSIKGGEKLLLVDDIMTSGATAYQCAFQLYKHGASSVVPVVFAKDNYREKGVAKNVKRNTKYNFTRAVKGFVRNGSQ